MVRGLRALEQRPQLDDVAVPRQRGEERQRRPRQGPGRELLQRADVPQQIRCDCRDVLAALSEGRHVDADDRQLSEVSCLTAPQLPVGSCQLPVPSLPGSPLAAPICGRRDASRGLTPA